MITETQTPASIGAGAEPAGAPWSDPGIQQFVEWRDGDIVISVPVKSGTTWTMNIVHQLRSGGDRDFDDVYRVVPWLEIVPAPAVTREQRLAKFAAMPRHLRRAFKTHSAPGPLPYQPPGRGKDVKYVVVVRHPDEAVASMHPFIASHSKAWFDLWQLPREAFVKPDFDGFFRELGKPLIARMIFDFAAAWWPLRNAPNVLLMHFTDMKLDHAASVRKIGSFLGLEPAADRWPTVLECTSFKWMKANEDKFELRSVTEVPILDPGAMMRSGKIGAARDDGVTPAISAEIAAIGRPLLSDAAFEWCYRGGPLPA